MIKYGKNSFPVINVKIKNNHSRADFNSNLFCRLLENELKSFEQLASENKTDNIKSSDNRKYRSRSPLLKKDDSFFDEDKNIEQEKVNLNTNHSIILNINLEKYHLH